VTGFDGTIFVLKREEVKAEANGSIEETIYNLYSWDSQKQVPRLTLPHVEISQSIFVGSLMANIWKSEATLEQVLAMQESSTKHKTAWSYAEITNSYGPGKAYGAAQAFEYISEVNKNYGSSIKGNDTVAKNYAQALYSALTRNDYSRLDNWESLKQDSVLGTAMTKAMDAQFAVTEALGNVGGGQYPSAQDAQSALDGALNEFLNVLNGNEQYKRDYENTVAAYQAVYDYFTVNPGAAIEGGPDIFRNNLNGTAANSTGAMAAAVLMSLGSTKNILDAYLSGK
jgi:hypothetical protein